MSKLSAIADLFWCYFLSVEIEEASSAVITAILKGERERVRSIACDTELSERVCTVHYCLPYAVQFH